MLPTYHMEIAVLPSLTRFLCAHILMEVALSLPCRSGCNFVCTHSTYCMEHCKEALPRRLYKQLAIPTQKLRRSRERLACMHACMHAGFACRIIITIIAISTTSTTSTRVAQGEAHGITRPVL